MKEEKKKRGSWEHARRLLWRVGVLMTLCGQESEYVCSTRWMDQTMLVCCIACIMTHRQRKEARQKNERDERNTGKTQEQVRRDAAHCCCGVVVVTLPLLLTTVTTAVALP